MAMLVVTLSASQLNILGILPKFEDVSGLL